MDFAEAREAFFAPRDDAAPGPDRSSAARRLRHALEPLAMVSVWGDHAAGQLGALGLNFLTGYVGSRACVLGDPDATVVAATFGVFEPGLVADLWRGARAQAGVEDLRRARVAAAGGALSDVLHDVDPGEIDRVVDALRAALESAPADLVGRPLYAGLRSLPWPDDAYARLWHAATLMREHRGDAHLGACVTAGLDGLEANILTELRAGYSILEYTASRGWPQDAMNAAVNRLEARGLVAGGALTDEGKHFREALEEVTDHAEDRLVAALGDDLTRLVDAVEPWAEAVVARGWFPPDPYKRTAG